MRMSVMGVIISGLILGACAPKIPEIPKDAKITIAIDPSANEGVNRDWWEQFDDKNLIFLIQKARSYNSDIQIAQTHIKEALGALRVARATLIPSVDISANPQYSKNPLTSLFGFTTPIGVFDPSLNISYHFDFFKKDFNERKNKLYTAQAIIAQKYATDISIEATLAKTYINLLSLLERQKLLQDTLKTKAKELDISQSKASTGYTSTYDTQAAKIQYEAIKSQLAPVQLAIIKTKNALEELTGIPAKDLPLTQSLDLIAQPHLPTKIPSSILRNRPDIAYAEFKLAASSASLAKARANFLPDFNLVANIGAFMSSNFTGLGAVLPVGALGSSILAPIFEGGKLKGEFAIANAQRDEAAYTYKKIVLNALKEIKNAQASIQWIKNQQYSLVKEYQMSIQSLKYAQSRYESGYSSYLEVLNAKQSSLDLQIQITNLKSLYIQSLIDLYHALGSGFDTDKIPTEKALKEQAKTQAKKIKQTNSEDSKDK
ncbi:hypothetical protein BKH46_02625 [Helicobacter sp. 12S02634-8]|uniref:efflux transporter outer membrane subunit n=1 Tax=Helicobacter sp. 12S02634-8 TaxID=1476199 RepID=UPI000BA7CE9C|nr:efflux transporter outer membrane subunit [Helicobacter sp. 12S02634-8]PAF47750.1 hypothetical protein BKH46_02625 [Helicobacter sp. 12S02634-8]